MFDFGAKWAPARFEEPDLWSGIEMRLVPGLRVVLASGDISSALRAFRMEGPALGATAVARGESFALAVARDRLLIVCSEATPFEDGWVNGLALTEVTDGISVIALSGPALPELVSSATTLDWKQPTRSASITFAGLTAAAVFHGSSDRLWLFLDTPLVPALRAWITAAIHVSNPISMSVRAPQ